MLVYGPAGWVRFDAGDAGTAGPVYARVNGAGRVVGLVVGAEGGSEITAGQLRRLPLARLAALVNARPDLLLAQSDAPDPEVLERLDREFPARRHRPTFDPDARLEPPGRNGLDDAFLRQVAAAYTAAVARGERPNRSLAKQVGHASTRTVESWVYISRKRGFLAKGRPGAAG